MYVVLDGEPGDLLGRLEHGADRDVEAEIGESGGDHLLAAVVPVLAHLGDEDAGLRPVRPLEGGDLCLDPVDDGVLADRLAIDAGDGLHRRNVAAKRPLQRQRNLADRGLRTRRPDGELEQIAVAMRSGRQLVERGFGRGDVARTLQLLEFGQLPRPHFGVVDLQHVDFDVSLRLVDVDAEQHLLAGIDARLRPRSSLLDTELRDPLFDRRRHAAQAFDLLDMAERLGREVVGEFFHEGRAAPGVDQPGRAGFALEDELGVAGDPRRMVGRQRQRLVEGVGVQRLRVALRRGHRLDHRAHDVVVGVLRRQRPA